MYSIGSLNSSSVGLYTGASAISWSRVRFGPGSLACVGCPLRSTVDKSRGSERRPLKGRDALLGGGGGATLDAFTLGATEAAGVPVPSVAVAVEVAGLFTAVNEEEPPPAGACTILVVIDDA